MKKLYALLFCLIILSLSVFGCGESSKPSFSPQNNSGTNNEESIPDLTGTWRSDNDNGSYQEANISEDTIEIYWITDNGDTRSIYWVGTYDPPTEAVEEYTWTSIRDKEATSSALLASQDDTKNITYSNEEISYQTSMLGTTSTMRLKKVE